MIVGVHEFDVDDWEKNTIYRNYDKGSKQIGWFWKVCCVWITCVLILVFELSQNCSLEEKTIYLLFQCRSFESTTMRSVHDYYSL